MPSWPREGGDIPIIVITGMSGAGRSTATKVLEDRGWYVVDNLPPELLGELNVLRAQALQVSPDGMPRLAVVIDARTRWSSEEFAEALSRLRAGPVPAVLVFLDATDEALVRRFESVRRPHPRQGDGRLLDAIMAERDLLADLRSGADVFVDTSGLNVHQLTAKLATLLDAQSDSRMRIAVMSFGFKYGLPLDADFVADMRFLPNPFWVPELRTKTGLDESVANYVLQHQGSGEFIDRMIGMLEPVTEGYLREGRRYATIAIGCTGGKHRSVAMTEVLAARLSGDRVTPFVVHRDLGRE
ncbi:MAG: RNase adapter RapZ [Actinomycetales bacterium]|nr:MAG: RNase adapter RapZ [Actinomycetales bacterium]